MSYIKKILRLYIRNILDGRITTAVGLAVIILGIVRGFDGADYTTIIELVVLGLVIIGFRDPRLGPPTQNDPPKDS